MKTRTVWHIGVTAVLLAVAQCAQFPGGDPVQPSPQAQISGEVVDAQGEPVEDADVLLVGENPDGTLQTVARVRTRDDGSYTIARSSREHYTLTVVTREGAVAVADDEVSRLRVVLEDPTAARERPVLDCAIRAQALQDAFEARLDVIRASGDRAEYQQLTDRYSAARQRLALECAPAPVREPETRTTHEPMSCEELIQQVKDRYEPLIQRLKAAGDEERLAQVMEEYRIARQRVANACASPQPAPMTR